MNINIPDLHKNVNLFPISVYYDSNKNFSNFHKTEEVDLSGLQKVVTKNIWSHILYHDNKRLEKHFQSTNMLVLDVDEGLSLSEAVKLFAEYKHIIFTTKSHQKEKNGVVADRFRVVLFLDKTITDLEEYKQIALFYTSSVFDFCDGACKDGARFWFPSKEVVSQVNEGKLLSTNIADMVAVNGRNNAAYKIAKTAQSKNLQVAPIVDLFNKKLSNPLPQSEVDSVVKSANRNVEYKKLPHHLRLILKNELDLELRFNERTNTVEIDGEPIRDIKITKIVESISEKFGIGFTSGAVQDAINALASDCSYDPIKTYFNKLKWDGKVRLENIAKVFGLNESDRGYVKYNEFVRKTLIAAVARTYNPGCKHDTILILTGKQGTKKSTFFKTLSPHEEYFCDSINVLEMNKDTKINMHKHFIIEIAEMVGHNKKESENIKCFLSSQKEIERGAYARNPEELKRRFIFCGTTNKDEFLKDESGNRRYWIVPVKMVIDVDYIENNRDQLWAEAKQLFLNGEKHYLDSNDETDELNEAYLETDAWLSDIEEYIASHPKQHYRLNDFYLALNIQTEDKNTQNQRRITKILKNLGYSNVQKKMNGENTKVWIKDSNIS